MIYAITPEKMRALEQAAFADGLPSLELMETAARAAFEALRTLVPAGSRVAFLCGPGNNGGDGLAMARLWREAGGQARVVMPQPPATEDAKTNLARLGLSPVPLTAAAGCDAIVDALFGTGFHGAAGSPFSELIAWANGAGCPVLSVDIPSGMNGLTGAAEGPCIRADRTVTFHRVKTGLLLTAHPELAGQVIPADIGLADGDCLPCAEPGDLASLLPPRAPWAHKGDCGRVTVFAGSMGMAGAAVMAAKAALRAGSGLVTALCPREIIPILQTAVPNAMCRAAEERLYPPCDALLLGCGIAENEESWQTLLRLQSGGTPAVWDAGALNLLARHPMQLGSAAVITPHLGEAARLLGVTVGEVQRNLLSAAERLRKKYLCNVVLKSAVTVLCAADGRLALHTVGSPALAKGGSGDALAGILASLLGQGLPVTQAMQAACLWHGLAGRLAGERYGIRSALTEEVISCLGEAERACRRREAER